MKYWSEGPDELGTHEDTSYRVEARSIEQIFIECENDIASVSPNFSSPEVMFDNGYFSCLMYRRGCPDDCSMEWSFGYVQAKRFWMQILHPTAFLGKVSMS